MHTPKIIGAVVKKRINTALFFRQIYYISSRTEYQLDKLPEQLDRQENNLIAPINYFYDNLAISKKNTRKIGASPGSVSDVYPKLRNSVVTDNMRSLFNCDDYSFRTTRCAPGSSTYGFQTYSFTAYHSCDELRNLSYHLCQKPVEKTKRTPPSVATHLLCPLLLLS